jgi:hypothetical protein
MLPILALALILAADPVPKSDGTTPRKPNPFAPSLPLLTDEEEKQFDDIIDRFIQADTGKMTGPMARKAMDEFKELGPEATFALIRGMNKAAKINHSCPALTIGRKLSTIVRSSDDKSLLLYAKENIGLGIKSSQHMDTIKDLKSSCTQRISAIKNAPTVEIRGLKP